MHGPWEKSSVAEFGPGHTPLPEEPRGAEPIDPPSSSPEETDAFLDWVAERAMTLVEEGRGVELHALRRLRPELSQQVKMLIEAVRGASLTEIDTTPAIGGYTILQELGRGGMGVVYLARQERLGGRPVAIKVLPVGTTLSPLARERFYAEAKAIAALRHPNILSVHDIVRENETIALVMEWVEGASLQALIEGLRGLHAGRTGDAARDAPRDPEMSEVRSVLRTRINAVGEVNRGGKAFAHRSDDAGPTDSSYIVFTCRVGITIARALDAVHRAGLLHRDVKPSNILLRSDGTALLSDFGLVAGLDAGERGASGRCEGTPAYAAPEQWTGVGADQRSDVFGLGMTLYRALALAPWSPEGDGTDPVRFSSGSTGIKGAAQRGVNLRAVNPRVPRDLETILAKAIDAQPAQRYQSAAELADDLERLLNLEPIRAKASGAVARFMKLARRNRRVLLGSVAGAVAAVLLCGVMIFAIFIAPAWSREHARAAELELLNPQQATRLWNALFFDDPGADRISVEHVLIDGGSKRALREYDAALTLAPFNEHLRLDRDTIALAIEIVTSGDAGRARDIERDAPLTAAYARRAAPEFFNRKQMREAPPIPADAGAKDVRAMGLLAYVLDEPLTTLAAWTRLDALGRSEPLTDGVLGIMHLISERPGLAYHRLRAAASAFPEIGYLQVYLADAATQCGDLEWAERSLRTSLACAKQDPQGAADRVRLMLDLAEGKTADATRRYLLDAESIKRPLAGGFYSMVLGYQYALAIERLGEPDAALAEMRRAMGYSSKPPRRVSAHFIRLADLWWQKQTLAERERLVREELPERNEEASQNFAGLVETYRNAATILENAGMHVDRARGLGAIALGDGVTAKKN